MDFSSCPLLPLYTREALYRLSAVDWGLAEPRTHAPQEVQRSPLRLQGLRTPPPPPPGLKAQFWPRGLHQKLTTAPLDLVTILLHSAVFWLPACLPATLSCPVESEMLWLPPDTLSSLGAFLAGDRPRPQHTGAFFSHHHVLSAFPKQKEQIIKT